MPLYIEQYATLFEGGKGQLPAEPLGTEPTQKLTVGATTVRTSENFDSATQILILSTDTDCQFEVGDDTVTADTNSRILFANTYRAIEVKESDDRIAVIQKQ